MAFELTKESLLNSGKFKDFLDYFLEEAKRVSPEKASLTQSIHDAYSSDYDIFTQQFSELKEELELLLYEPMRELYNSKTPQDLINAGKIFPRHIDRGWSRDPYSESRHVYIAPEFEIEKLYTAHIFVLQAQESVKKTHS